MKSRKWILKDHGDGGICALGPQIDASEKIDVIEKSAYNALAESNEKLVEVLRCINKEVDDDGMGGWLTDLVSEALAEHTERMEKLK